MRMRKTAATVLAAFAALIILHGLGVSPAVSENGNAAGPTDTTYCLYSTIDFTPNGEAILAIDDGGKVVLWNLKTGKHQTVVTDRDPKNSSGSSSIAMSRDGTTIATARKHGGGFTGPHVITLWNLKTGKALQSLRGHFHLVTSMQFSPNGKLLASGSWDETVRVWNVDTGKPLKVGKAHTHSVWQVAFNPAGTLLASASSDKTVKLWDVKTMKVVKTITGHRDKVYSLSFSPDGTRIVSGGGDRTIRIWNAKSGMELTAIAAHRETVSAVSFGPNGNIIASGSTNGFIKIWDSTTGKMQRKLRGHWSPQNRVNAVYDLRFSTRGKTLASSNGRTVKLWDVEKGSELREFPGTQ